MISYETTSKHARQIAAELLSIKAIKINPDSPYTWSSGWKSPIYCDNRLSLSYVQTRTIIKQALADLIKDKFPDATAIAGVATAGIAQGALVADALQLPYLYVRPKPKDHGMGNQIEGRLEDNARVVLIEDLVSTGGSSIKAAEALQAAGAVVLGMAAIFTYGFPQAEENYKKSEIALYCLSNYEVMLEQAIQAGYIATSDLEQLQAWRKNPETWGQ